MKISNLLKISNIYIISLYNWKICLMLMLLKIMLMLKKNFKKRLSYDIITLSEARYGFFADCSGRLEEIIKYYNLNQREPNYIDGSERFILYKKATDYCNDITYDFFEDFVNITDGIDIIYKIYSCYKMIITSWYEKYSEMDYKPLKFIIKKYFSPSNEIIITSWDEKYSEMDYKFVKSIIKKYFSPSNKINKIISDIEQKYNIKHNNTLAVYYRGTDKYKETQLSPFNEFYKQIIGIVNKNKNIKILLQSDCANFIDYITNKKIKNIFIIEENNTSYTNKGIHYEQTSDENYYDMLNFLSTIIILSRCKYIICSSGNCSVWMMLYRGNGKNVIQYLKGNWHNSIV